MAALASHPQGRPEKVVQMRHRLEFKTLFERLAAARFRRWSKRRVAIACPISHCL
jgi:hypothetical protein